MKVTYLFEKEDELDHKTGETVDTGNEVTETDEEGSFSESKED